MDTTKHEEAHDRLKEKSIAELLARKAEDEAKLVTLKARKERQEAQQDVDNLYKDLL